MEKKNKVLLALLFCIIASVMGGLVGFIVWAFMTLMNLLINLIWTTLPMTIHASDGVSGLVYALIICVLGGALIGLWQKKFGLYPDELEEVLEKSKNGGYPYNNLPVIFVAALLPLIFGGTLGPEAGMSGLIAGLCCLVGSRLKLGKDRVMDLSEINVAAVLSIVFRTPILGIVADVEPELIEHRKVKRPVKILVYGCAIVCGFLVYKFLGQFGGGMGFPRFEPKHAIGLDQIKWYPLLIVVGIIAAWFYMLCDKLTKKISEKISSPIARCILAGVAVAIVGWLIPYTMFSGEHALHELMDNWGTLSALLLAAICVGKLLLTNVCINLGWRGGSIFPIIFAGSALGFSFAVMTGMDGALAVAVLVTALYAHIKKKPLMAASVLLLCFPITYIIPMLISAFVAAKIPSPKILQYSSEHE